MQAHRLTAIVAITRLNALIWIKHTFGEWFYSADALNRCDHLLHPRWVTSSTRSTQGYDLIYL